MTSDTGVPSRGGRDRKAENDQRRLPRRTILPRISSDVGKVPVQRPAKHPATGIWADHHSKECGNERNPPAASIGDNVASRSVAQRVFPTRTLPPTSAMGEVPRTEIWGGLTVVRQWSWDIPLSGGTITMPNYEYATKAEARAMIGKTWIERSNYFDLSTGKTFPAPEKKYVILDAEPADDTYYHICTTATRRVKCSLGRVRPDGTVVPPTRGIHRWLQPEEVQ